MMFWSLPHEAVMSATASFLRARRSLRTPSIMASGISKSKMSAPTPSELEDRAVAPGERTAATLGVAEVRQAWDEIDGVKLLRQ